MTARDGPAAACLGRIADPDGNESLLVTPGALEDGPAAHFHFRTLRSSEKSSVQARTGGRLMSACQPSLPRGS